MRISGFQWLLCGLAALSLHALLFAFVRPEDIDAVAAQQDGPTIEVSADSLAGIIGAAVEVQSTDTPDVVKPVEPLDIAEPEVTPEPVSQVAMTAPVPPPADLPDLVQIPTSEPVEDIEVKELAPPVVKAKPVETKTEPPKKKTERKKKTEKVTKKKTKQRKKSAKRGNSKSGAGGSSKSRASSAAIAAYGGKVRSRVLSRAPRGGAGQGTVTVSFSISPSGSLSSARVSRSSGNPGLDNKALSAVRSASPFPKPPAGARRSFSIPFRFR